MLQAAYGGYFLRNEDDYIISTPVYREPGFDIMNPLEIEIDSSDRFYMLLRKRTAEGHYEDVDIDNLTISIKDATIGENIPFRARINDISESWNDNPSEYIPLVLSIDSSINIENPKIRTRVIDCSISDSSDNSFLFFRITMSPNVETEMFHYIPVSTSKVSARNKFSIPSNNAYVTIVPESDTYILFSPYAYLSEVDEDHADFSYPINTIFYKRQKTYNEENYRFSIDSYSNSSIVNFLTLINVPGYNYCAVLLVDRSLYREIIKIGANPYIDIGVSGYLSSDNSSESVDHQNNFRINFLT